MASGVDKHPPTHPPTYTHTHTHTTHTHRNTHNTHTQHTHKLLTYIAVSPVKMQTGFSIECNLLLLLLHDTVIGEETKPSADRIERPS